MGTGTVRKNRIGKLCPLTKKKKFRKESRGKFESVIEKNDGIMYVQWMDNSAVIVASMKIGVNPVRGVTRFSKAQRKKYLCSTSRLIGQYNSFIGDADLMDENIN